MSEPDRSLRNTTVRQGRNREGPGSPSVARPTLTLAYGPEPARSGERVVLDRKPVRLDRCEPLFPGGPLDDPEMSRAHAELIPEPAGEWRLRDLRSTNGTFVDGSEVPCSGVLLRPGNVIQVGSALFLFRVAQVPAPPESAIPGLLGTSDEMRVLRAAIQRYAPVQVSVVVLGETGTGKELVASALASLGRPSRPFVAFNASTTPGPLVDSTLFGHERGAFTDAKQSRPGLFRAAHGGTLFLDEVGDLPAETQAKLLRVLEEGRVLPVGATASIAVDVRLVSATHKDLLSEVEAGRFRADLYARLAFVVLRLSPLRDRPEDIPVLAQAFASGRRFEPSAMTALLLHPWPFNARELKAVVGQMVLETPASRRLDLPQGVRDRLAEHRRLFGGEPQPRETAGRPPAGTLDRAAVEQALRQGRGNMTRAAEIAGRDRSHFYRMVRRFGLVPEDFRP